MWTKIMSIGKKLATKKAAEKATNTSDGQTLFDQLGKFKIAMGCFPIVALVFILVAPLLILIPSFSAIHLLQFVDPAYADQTSSSSGTLTSSEFDEFYFNQCDGEWSGDIYDFNNSSICEAGCGLCSITHIIDILTNNKYTPGEVNKQLREHYNGNVGIYAPGGSSVAKLVEFAVEKYNLKSTHHSNVDDALKDMKSGNKVLICSDNGNGLNFVLPDGGGMYSGNHVIMCYKTDGENCWVKDSGKAGGNSVKYTKQQLGNINYIGYYVLSK